MSVYYNEIDKQKCMVLRELMREGVIAQGEIDDRSIADVQPADLVGFSQCHFFAGIGIWSYAFRLARIPDDWPAWTLSCPCPSFSAAGKGGGFDDPRHLWPHADRLIAVAKPPVLFGEQADDAIGYGWIDLVQANLEAKAYALGKAVLGACSVGAPEIRQRLYFVAESTSQRHDGWGTSEALPRSEPEQEPQRCSDAGELAIYESDGRRQELPLRGRRMEGNGAQGQPSGLDSGCAPSNVGYSAIDGERSLDGQSEPRRGPEKSAGGSGISCVLRNAVREGLQGQSRHGDYRNQSRRISAESAGSASSAGPISGFWRDAEWIPCRVPAIPGAVEWRPIKPGTQRMVDGTAPNLLPMCDSRLAQIKEEINGIYPNQTHARKALSNLWNSLATQEIQRATGGLDGVHEESVLFAFLCQLQKQGFEISSSLPCESSQATQEKLRVLRDHQEASCPSCRRRLEEQRAGECSDPLHILSLLLACHAQEARVEADDAHAVHNFCLARNAKARVLALRAFGDGIVAPLAAEFITAYLETKGLIAPPLSAMG